MFVMPEETNSYKVMADALGNIASSAAKSHLDRADEMALQKAVQGLPKDYTPRQLLDVITNTPTHSNARKQEMLKNYMGIEEFEASRKKADAEAALKKAKIDAQNEATGLRNRQLDETTRHNKAVEATQAIDVANKVEIATGKNITAKDIATGKTKSTELINIQKLVSQAELQDQKINFKSQELAFEKEQAAQKLELAKAKLANDIEAARAKSAQADAAEKRKDTQGAEKLRLEAEDLKRKIEEQKIKVDQFDKQFEMKSDHFNRNLEFEGLKLQETLNLKAQEADIKLQELQGKLDNQDALLEEKKRQFDLNYELSMSKDLREQEAAQADLDKIKHEIEHDQNTLNATVKYRDEQQAIAREKNKIAMDKLKQTNPSEFEKVRARNVAKEYEGLEKDIPKMQNTNALIKKVTGLASEMGWGGPIEKLFGTKNAAELESLSYLLLEPMIHIFNPVGPLGAKKLETLKDIYQIRATDTPNTKKGKIDAIQLINDQALKLAEDRKRLIEQYNGPPPINVMEKLDQDAESLFDTAVNYDFSGKAVSRPGMPDPSKKKANGDWPTITDKTTGEKFKSDGVRWLKV